MSAVKPRGSQSRLRTVAVPECRIADKRGVADFFAVELVTVDQWIRKGAPVIERGSQGVAWRFDLLAIAIWRYGPKEEEDPKDPESMAPKARLDWYRGAQEKDRWLESSGQLLPRAVVRKQWASMIVAARNALLGSIPTLSAQLANTSDAAEIRALLFGFYSRKVLPKLSGWAREGDRGRRGE